MKKVSGIFSKYLICISTYNWLSWISFTKCKEVKMTWGPDILHIQHIRDHMVKLQLDKNSVPRIKRFYPWTGTHLHGAVLVVSWAVPIVWRIGGLHVLHRVQIFTMRFVQAKPSTAQHLLDILVIMEILLSDSPEDMLTVGTNKVIISGNNAPLHRAPPSGASVACSEWPSRVWLLPPSHSQQGSISVHTALSTSCNSVHQLAVIICEGTME